MPELKWRYGYFLVLSIIAPFAARCIGASGVMDGYREKDDTVSSPTGASRMSLTIPISRLCRGCLFPLDFICLSAHLSSMTRPYSNDAFAAGRRLSDAEQRIA